MKVSFLGFAGLQRGADCDCCEEAELQKGLV
jgi:hypothetical protein